MAAVTESVTTPRKASDFEKFSMQQNLFLSDSLLDLENLKTQLYSAAEYFELSYTNDEQKDIVVAALKDYAIKAVVNTVDHLGSITYKANNLVDEKVNEVSGTELRVSSVEQRLQTCQEYTDHGGRSQQSLVMNTPKYNKRYILPVDEHCGTTSGANGNKSWYQGCTVDDEDDWNEIRSAVRSTIKGTQTSSVRKGSSPSQPQKPSPQNFSLTITTTRKEIGKRTVSPLRFPLLRTKSFSSRSATPKTSRATTPNKSRSTTPNPSAARWLYPSEPQKSASMRLPSDREHGKDIEQHPSKGKRILKALLSRRKSKKDEMLYTYLDEY